MAENDYEELRERLQVEALRVWKRHLLSPTDLVTDLMPLIEAERRKRDEHWEGQARDWLRAIDEQREQLEQCRQREAALTQELQTLMAHIDALADSEGDEWKRHILEANATMLRMWNIEGVQEMKQKMRAAESREAEALKHLEELTWRCPSASTGRHCFYCEWYWPKVAGTLDKRHADDCPWLLTRSLLEAQKGGGRPAQEM